MTQPQSGAPQHEVFPNAPLQLVAVEVTYGATDLDVDTGLFAALRDVMGGEAQTRFGGLLRMVGPPDPSGATPGESILFRMTGRDRTVSVSAWPTSLVVECSDYDRYEAFRRLLVDVFDAYAQYVRPTSLTRFGMRYIDEVHVDAPIRSTTDWLPYVNPAILAPSTLIESHVTNLATGFTIDLGEARSVNVRCATSPSRALGSEGPLRLRDRPDTPALVLDIDAIYEPSGGPMQGPVTGELVVGVADSLRPAVRAVFDAVFTDTALRTFRSTKETA